MPVIDQFRGQYRFLSNFYPSTVVMYGKEYPTVEHAFQAAKSTDPAVRRTIREASTPGQAKRLGRSVILRPDWEEFKLTAMETLVRRKFEFDLKLRQKLIDTGEEELVEGNYWNDTFWGVDLRTGKGENNLGKILMKVRKDLS